MEQNPDMINEHNEAQFIILRDKILGEDITPYRLIARISENLSKLINIEEKINDKRPLNDRQKEYFELYKSKKKI